MKITVKITFILFLLLFGIGLLSTEAQVKVRKMNPDEFKKFKQKVGVYQEGKNYNEIINGHGTGLRPPTEEEWEEMKDKPFLIEEYKGKDKEEKDIPDSFDNSDFKWFPPVGDQGSEGSCVSWACGYYTKTFQEAHEHDWDLSDCDWTGGSAGQPDEAYHDKIFSPDFIYHLVNGGEDNGSFYSDNMNLLENIGCGTWDKMPYDTAVCTSWPSQAAWREAPLYRSKTGYQSMNVRTDDGLQNLKQLIADTNLAVISIESGQYSDLTHNDLWTVENYTNPSTTHANTIVGYDDNYGPYTENGETRYGAFKVVNSWGKEWRDDGFFYISYECMKNRIGHIYFYENLLNYSPEILAVFNIQHNISEECEIGFGIGDTSSPEEIKTMQKNYEKKWGSIPFPTDNMALDITELGSNTDDGFIKFFTEVIDKGTTTTGQIDFFSIEIYEDYSSGNPKSVYISDDTIVNTVNNSPVYARIEDSEPPTAPSNLSSYNITDSSAYLSWNESSDNVVVDHYIVFQDGSSIGTTSDTSYNVAGLSTGSNHTFTVKAKDATGNVSDASNAFDVTIQDAMAFEVNTKHSEGTDVTIPLNGNVDVTVYWGDGNYSTFTTSGNKTHTYAEEGNYTINITGTLEKYGDTGWDGNNFNDYPNADKLDKVTDFGDLGLTSLEGAYNGASNLSKVPDQLPSSVTDMSLMFRNATSFNQDIGDWDVSDVTDMSYMFYHAESFNQDIGSWDVGSVEDIKGMFAYTSFNQDIGDWDVSDVADMSDMFLGITLSTAYYNNLLIGWSEQELQSNVNFHGGDSKYSPGDAEDARTMLTDDPNNWNITDGGVSELAAVITREVSEISDTTAISGGEVTADGGYDITACGIVWHTEPNPTLDEKIGYTEDGDELGSFTSNIDNLDVPATYYVRAYATDQNGTEYGGQIQFKTTLELIISGDFTAKNKVYDGTAIAAIDKNNLNLNGKISEYENVSLTNFNVEFEDAKVSDNKTVSIVSAELNGADDDKYTLFLTGAPTTEADITHKKLTITGSFTVYDKEYDGTASAEIEQNELELEGVIGDDVVELVDVVAEFEEAEADDDIAVVIEEASLDGEDKDNYALSLEGAPTTTATISEVTSINEITEANIAVYPNPARENVNIKAGSKIDRIVIVDMSGMVIYDKMIKGTKSRISTTDIDTGLYILRVYTDKGVFQKKLQIQK
ncbi:MAG: BspA family leucine-rich repeat surface protein [Bacteroidales bacterium]